MLAKEDTVGFNSTWKLPNQGPFLDVHSGNLISTVEDLSIVELHPIKL